MEEALGRWEAEPESAAALEDARAGFAAAMGAWEILEVMQLGPAASSLDAAGGEDLRDAIYSWPTVSPCRVDQELVYQQWDAPGWFEDNLVNSYGLDAIEHLLYGGADNACSGQIDINEERSWDALDGAELARRRAGFGLALAGELDRLAEVLIDDWSPEGGDFSAALAGGDGSPYESQQEALDAVLDALFYLDVVTEDRKLAQPMGLGEDCGAETCPEDVELLESGLSLEAIRYNVLGFELLFTGGAGPGMDDLLEDLGYGDLAEQIAAELDAVEAASAALTAPIDRALVEDPEGLQALYEALEVLAGTLAEELTAVLMLDLPDEAAGDAD